VVVYELECPAWEQVRGYGRIAGVRGAAMQGCAGEAVGGDVGEGGGEDGGCGGGEGGGGGVFVGVVVVVGG